MDIGSTRSRVRYSGLLGDSIARDYAWKLKLFNAFAVPELKVAIASLALREGMRVRDAGPERRFRGLLRRWAATARCWESSFLPLIQRRPA